MQDDVLLAMLSITRRSNGDTLLVVQTIIQKSVQIIAYAGDIAVEEEIAKKEAKKLMKITIRTNSKGIFN